jgi:magnesium-transporting ATPase (P-type)
MAKKKAHKAPHKAAVKAPEITPEAVAAPTSTPTEAPVLPVTAAPEAEQKAEPEKPKRKPISIGIWAYFVGIIVALAAVLFIGSEMTYYVYAALAILGFMVGLLNITDNEILLFLVASVAFVVSSYTVRELLAATPGVTAFLANIIVFTAASAFIVSLKALVRVARDE